MKKAFMIAFLMCVLCITANAQSEIINYNTYITDDMAKKVANGITQALPLTERESRTWAFINANGISSTSECASILNNITNYKEKVANFIVSIYSRGGLIPTFPIAFFESIGFSDMEIEMAMKVAKLKLEMLRQDELEKRIAEEKGLINQWEEEGKDTIHFFEYDKRQERIQPSFVIAFRRTLEISDSIVILPDEYRSCDLSSDKGDVEVRFFIDEYGNISQNDMKEMQRYGIDTIKVLSPAMRYFEMMDTSYSVPSVNYLGIHAHRNSIQDKNKSYTATIRYDKKTDSWIVKKVNNKYGKLYDWFEKAYLYEKEWSPRAVLGVENYDELIEWLNDKLNKVLKGEDGKEFSIEFSFYPPGEITYYLNRRRIAQGKLKLAIQIIKKERIK